MGRGLEDHVVLLDGDLAVVACRGHQSVKHHRLASQRRLPHILVVWVGCVDAFQSFSPH